MNGAKFIMELKKKMITCSTHRQKKRKEDKTKQIQKLEKTKFTTITELNSNHPKSHENKYLSLQNKLE